tara:strand:- start:1396 stop:2115 length:720 start_codon:yes stop_codon:yes gene_type:complete
MEAIESVINSNFDDVEIVVVNDGSTDPKTLEILDSLNYKEVLLISQSNKGPASARNAGVRAATGDIFLFLDSDNVILPQYIEKALSILSDNMAVGVVYSNPIFFGNTSSEDRFYPKIYSYQELLLGNFIDMCSFVRRATFEEVGGFDEHRGLIGWEDWEIWLRVAQTDWQFHYLNEELFKYRIRKDSLMGLSNESKQNNMLEYIGQKHGKLFHELLRSSIRTKKILEKRTIQFWIKKWF